MISEGRFRQDLSYRISTFEMQVAPPRERRADIPSLARHFLDKLSSPSCLPLPITIEEEALRSLASYDWHGNVRELENVMNRLIVVAGTSTITRTDVETVLGIDPVPVTISSPQTYSCVHAEAKRVLRPTTSEVCEDETIKAYMRRVKLDVLTAAITQYPSRTAAAQRLGLTKEALKRQLRYLRNATARSISTLTNDQEKV